jgi:hypothetical protein
MRITSRAYRALDGEPVIDCEPTLDGKPRMGEVGSV